MPDEIRTTLTPEKADAALETAKTAIDAPEPKEDSDIVRQAKTYGWKPESDFHGLPGTWLSPEDFVRQYPLIERIRKQSRLIDNLKYETDHLRKSTLTVHKLAYEQAQKELQAKFDQAVLEGDVSGARQLHQQMTTTEVSAQREIQQVATPPGSNELPPPVKSWFETNKWFVTPDRVNNATSEMTDLTDAATAHDEYYQKKYPAMSFEDRLKKVDIFMQKNYSKELENYGIRTNGNGNGEDRRPQRVESGSQASGRTSRYNSSDLTDFEREACKQFVAQGVMTTEQYIKALEPEIRRRQNR